MTGDPKLHMQKVLIKLRIFFFFSSYLDKHIWKDRFEFSNRTRLSVSHWNVLEAIVYMAFSVS